MNRLHDLRAPVRPIDWARAADSHAYRCQLVQPKPGTVAAQARWAAEKEQEFRRRGEHDVADTYRGRNGTLQTVNLLRTLIRLVSQLKRQCPEARESLKHRLWGRRIPTRFYGPHYRCRVLHAGRSVTVVMASDRRVTVDSLSFKSLEGGLLFWAVAAALSPWPQVLHHLVVDFALTGLPLALTK